MKKAARLKKKVTSKRGCSDDGEMPALLSRGIFKIRCNGKGIGDLMPLTSTNKKPDGQLRTHNHPQNISAHAWGGGQCLWALMYENRMANSARIFFRNK
jgi:hypothetical protein